MSSLGLSHKNLLAPLLVSKQSVSPGPSVSLCYLVYLNLLLLSTFSLLHRSLIYLVHFNLYALSISPCSACLPYFLSVCFYAVFVSSSRLCVNFILVLIILHFFSIINVVFSDSRSTFNFFSQHLLFFYAVSFLMQHTTTVTYLSPFPSF